MTNPNSHLACVQAPAGVQGGSGNWTGADKSPILEGRERGGGQERQCGM